MNKIIIFKNSAIFNIHLISFEEDYQTINELLFSYDLTGFIPRIFKGNENKNIPKKDFENYFKEQYKPSLREIIENDAFVLTQDLILTKEENDLIQSEIDKSLYRRKISLNEHNQITNYSVFEFNELTNFLKRNVPEEFL